MNESFELKIWEPNTDEVKFVMGIDTYDDFKNGQWAYCLMRRIGNSSDVLLTKSNQASEEFLREVLDLKQYFNAVVMTEDLPLSKDTPQKVRELYNKILKNE